MDRVFQHKTQCPESVIEETREYFSTYRQRKAFLNRTLVAQEYQNQQLTNETSLKEKAAGQQRTSFE